MAIRFDASAEVASRTANLPTNNAFTMMCWAMLSADRNAASTFFHYGQSTGAGANTDKTLETTSDGTTLSIWDGFDSVSGTNLSVGVWYHLAMTFDGANAKAYVNAVLDITNPQTSLPLTSIRFGNDSAGDNEWLNGLIHGIKIWSAVLTQVEIQQEMQQIVPVRLASLNSWYPCEGNLSAMLQEGGRQYPGRVENVLTAGGTLAYEQGPPIPWRRTARRYIWDVPAAAASLTTSQELPAFVQAQVSGNFVGLMYQ